MDGDTITRIYCDIDDFCKALEAYCRAHSLPGAQKNSWFPAGRLSLSEVMTIILLFHLSGYRCFKWYYQRYLCLCLRSFFPAPVSYNRFVELTGCALLPPCSSIPRASGGGSPGGSVLSTLLPP